MSSHPIRPPDPAAQDPDVSGVPAPSSADERVGKLAEYDWYVGGEPASGRRGYAVAAAALIGLLLGLALLAAAVRFAMSS